MTLFEVKRLARPALLSILPCLTFVPCLLKFWTTRILQSQSPAASSSWFILCPAWNWLRRTTGGKLHVYFRNKAIDYSSKVGLFRWANVLESRVEGPHIKNIFWELGYPIHSSWDVGQLFIKNQRTVSITAASIYWALTLCQAPHLECAKQLHSQTTLQDKYYPCLHFAHEKKPGLTLEAKRQFHSHAACEWQEQVFNLDVLFRFLNHCTMPLATSVSFSEKGENSTDCLDSLGSSDCIRISV